MYYFRVNYVNNLSSTLNFDSEFSFKSERQGGFIRNSELFRMKPTKCVAFKTNSNFSISPLNTHLFRENSLKEPVITSSFSLKSEHL